MRILYIALSCGPLGGSEDAIGWNLPYEMAHRGHDVTVLTREDKREEIEGFINQHPDGAPYPTFEYEALNSFETRCTGPFYSVRAKSWCGRVDARVRALHARARYDVVHQITPVEYRSVVDLSDVDALTAIGPVGGGGEMPRSVHSYLHAGERAQEACRSLMNWQANHSPSVRRAYRSHDVMFATNDETAEILRGGLWSDEEVPIHSEVAVKVLRPPSRSGASRADASCSGASGGYVIGSAGRLHYGKGFKLLLEAFARLGVPGAVLRIAGDGAQRAELEELTRTLGISDCVEFLGRVDYQQMRDFYAGIDLFAFPSFREATGSVVVEALAMGCPVLALDIFGARHLLGRDPRFLVSSEGTREECVDRFAAAMRRLLLSGEYPSVRPEGLTWPAQCAWLEAEYERAAC